MSPFLPPVFAPDRLIFGDPQNPGAGPAFNAVAGGADGFISGTATGGAAGVFTLIAALFGAATPALNQAGLAFAIGSAIPLTNPIQNPGRFVLQAGCARASVFIGSRLPGPNLNLLPRLR